MQIRCKKCFRKYEDYEPECPNCGAVNERPFKSGKKEKKTFKIPEPTRKKCGFCGGDLGFFTSQCRICGNESQGISEVVREGVFEDLLERLYSRNGLLNTVLLEDSGLDLKSWKIPPYYRYGIRADKKVVYFIGLIAVVLLPLFFGPESLSTYLLSLLLIGLPALILSYYIAEHRRSEYLEFAYNSYEERVFINWMKKSDMERDINSKYSAYLSEIDYIELIYEDHLDSIRFVSKKDAKIRSKDITISLGGFEDEHDLIGYLLMLSYKYKLPVNISRNSKEEIIEEDKPEKTYVRIERNLQEPDETIVKNRHVYLKLLREDYDLTYGKINNGALMMIKSNDLGQLREDLDRDPYIENSIVEAKIEEWEIGE